MLNINSDQKMLAKSDAVELEVFKKYFLRKRPTQIDDKIRIEGSKQELIRFDFTVN